MLEKFGVHVSWLGAGAGKVAKGKVGKSIVGNAINLEERNSGPPQSQQGNDENQLGIVLPQLELDMALVLVLVQDNSVALNSAAGSSQNRLAPPTPSSE